MNKIEMTKEFYKFMLTKAPTINFADWPIEFKAEANILRGDGKYNGKIVFKFLSYLGIWTAFPNKKDERCELNFKYKLDDDVSPVFTNDNVETEDISQRIVTSTSKVKARLQNWDNVTYPCHGVFMRDDCGTPENAFKVLFLAPKIGTVVEKNCPKCKRVVGEFSTVWAMEAFDIAEVGTTTTFTTLY